MHPFFIIQKESPSAIGALPATVVSQLKELVWLAEKGEHRFRWTALGTIRLDG
jgi:D-alanine-D-alanine ligase-like ATP-grasp enzyme